MASTTSATTHVSLLWNNTKLHSLRASSQVTTELHCHHHSYSLQRSICQQISYTYMLPFENIPDDTVPVTAFLKELLKMANKERPLLILSLIHI